MLSLRVYEPILYSTTFLEDITARCACHLAAQHPAHGRLLAGQLYHYRGSGAAG